MHASQVHNLGGKGRDGTAYALGFGFDEWIGLTLTLVPIVAGIPNLRMRLGGRENRSGAFSKIDSLGLSGERTYLVPKQATFGDKFPGILLYTRLQCFCWFFAVRVVLYRSVSSARRFFFSGFGTQFAIAVICKDEWTADRVVEAHKSRGSWFVRVICMLQAVVSKVVSRFVRDERGATMLEYGLLVGLIAIVAIGAIGALGTSLGDFFTDTTAELNNV